MTMSPRRIAASIAVLITSAASGQTCETWSIVDNPVYQGQETIPNHILPFSADSAVGLSNATIDGQSAIAYMPWEGTEWTVPHTDPVEIGITSDMRAARGSAPDDIWITGTVRVDTLLLLPYLAHWDGQEWSAVEAIMEPRQGFPGSGSGADLVVFAPDDIWVIGTANDYNASSGEILACHWDGSSLEEAGAIPHLFNRINLLRAADGADANNIWAVGDGRNISGSFRSLLVYWDGTGWGPQSFTPLPGENALSDGLWDVIVFATDDAWAVGKKNLGGQSHSMYLHWDGSSWTEIAGPNIGPLTSVTGSGPDDMWASVSFGEYGGRMVHWDGATWTEFNTAPIPGATHIGLSNLSSSGPCDVWATGYWGIYDGQGWVERHSIIEHLAPLSAETVCPDGPDDFERGFGGPVTGDALDLCLSDDVRMNVLQSARLSPLLPFIRLEYWAHSTFADSSVTSVEYTIEGHVSALVAGGQNPDTLRTSIRNYAGGFEIIDQRGTGADADETISHVQTTNAPDYVNAGDGEVRVRQEVFDPGLVFTPNWFLKVDLYEVTVAQ
jgi:hypothetical protein